MLSERSGVSNSLISAVRRGKPTTTDTLEKLLAAMEEIAPGSRGYFYHQMAGSDHLIELVSTIPDDQLATIIDIVAERIRSGGKISHPQETLIGA